MIFLPFDSRRIPPQPIGWSDHGANIPYNIRNSECRHWRNFLIERDRSRLLCHTLLHGLIFREKTCTEPMRRPASGFYKPAGFQLHEDHMGRGAAQHRIQIETANTRESTRIAVARTLTAFAAVSAATEEQARVSLGYEDAARPEATPHPASQTYETRLFTAVFLIRVLHKYGNGPYIFRSPAYGLHKSPVPN